MCLLGLVRISSCSPLQELKPSWQAKQETPPLKKLLIETGVHVQLHPGISYWIRRMHRRQEATHSHERQGPQIQLPMAMSMLSNPEGL